MVDAAKTVAAGGAALGADPSIVQSAIASFQGIVPKGTDWRELWQANVLEAH